MSARRGRDTDTKKTSGENPSGRLAEAGRICKGGCGTILRRTNLNEYCSLCKQVRREDAFTTFMSGATARKLARQELERKRRENGTRLAFTIY